MFSNSVGGKRSQHTGSGWEGGGGTGLQDSPGMALQNSGSSTHRGVPLRSSLRDAAVVIGWRHKSREHDNRARMRA